MAKKYTNFRIGGSPQKVTDDYTVWSNDILHRIIASSWINQNFEPKEVEVPVRPSNNLIVSLSIFGKILCQILNAN